MVDNRDLVIDVEWETDGDLEALESLETRWVIPYDVYNDADGETDDLNMVVGFRIDRQDPAMRIFTAWVYNLMIRFLFGLRVRDVDCSFKVFRRQIFDGMTIRARSGLADAEILIKAIKGGSRFVEVGVHHYPRTHGATSYNIGRWQNFGFVKPSVVTEIIGEIRRLWKELR